MRSWGRRCDNRGCAPGVANPGQTVDRRGAPTVCVEERRLAAIAKLPPARDPIVEDDEFEVVFSGKDSLSKFARVG
jgi:hypothetical protein